MFVGVFVLIAAQRTANASILTITSRYEGRPGEAQQAAAYAKEAASRYL